MKEFSPDQIILIVVLAVLIACLCFYRQLYP